MTIYVRRQSLMDTLRKQPGLRVSELAKLLDVSEGTVRNDLNALEDDGTLKRIHGGAILYGQSQFENNSFQQRYKQNVEAKLAIVNEAARLVDDGDSVLLDASSTAYYLACKISERQRLRVVTNGLEVARQLARNSSNIVILIGGVFNNDSSSVTGLLSERIIEEMHIDKAFVSCSGFSLNRGMTEVHLAEAQIKRKIIDSCHQLFALIDSSKFGKEDMTPFAKVEEITRLFSDKHLSSEWERKLSEANVKFIICEKKAGASQ